MDGDVWASFTSQLCRVNWMQLATQGGGGGRRIVTVLGAPDALQECGEEVGWAQEHCWEQLHLEEWKKVPQIWAAAYAVATFALASSAWRKGEWMEAMRLLDMILLVGHGDFHPVAQMAVAALHPLLPGLAKVDPWPSRPPLELSSAFLHFASTAELVDRMAITEFGRVYHTPGVPVVLRGLAREWPAVTRWRDAEYLMRVAGPRTVPVEVGSSYAHDEGWSQRLMTFAQFYERHVVHLEQPTGYLAQTHLLEQIPALLRDVVVPDECCLGDGGNVEINAWFGPEGTVSPLHTDRRDNILCQLVGSKAVLTFGASDTPFLYPHSVGLITNTSRVDAEAPNVAEFPLYAKAATGSITVLRAGDAVFIPRGVWHFCKSLEPSWSLSFWF